MKHRTFALPLLFISSLGFLLACGSDDDKTPATCAAICAQQSDLCKATKDCDTTCSVVAQVLKKTGCEAEYQQGLDCLAEKNVCDDDETACPGESFFACIGRFCAAPANASDPLCAD